MLNMEDVKQVEKIVESKVGELAAITQQGFLEVQRNFDGLVGRVDGLASTVDTLSIIVDKLSTTLDKVAVLALDNQENVQKLDTRMARMEDSQEKMFNKIDGFLTVLNRHESEIAGLSDHGRRSDERIAHLEARA